MTTPTASPSRTYSPFWALWVVFATLSALQATYLVNDFSERSQVIASKRDVDRLMPEVEKINRATESMGKGILDLANAGSGEAKKIAAEMQIKVNTPVTVPRPK